MTGVFSPFRSIVQVFRRFPAVMGGLGLPLRAGGRWAFILPTRPGWVFFGMLLILFLGSINHGNNLGFLLTFLLGGVVFVSIVHTVRNISGLEPAAVRAEPVFAGQDAFFAVTLPEVSGSRPSVVFRFPGGDPTLVHLGEGGQTVRVMHPSVRRGELRPPLVTVATTFPLGLFRCWTHLPVKASCLVYPRPLDGPMISASTPTDGDRGGEYGGNGADDFAGLEAYRRGDPLQHISWKAFSRGQGLYTKKFEGRQGATLFFDPDNLPGLDPEEKLSRLCAMVLKAEALRLAYGLRLGDRLVEPGQGGSHKRRCLRELALAWM